MRWPRAVWRLLRACVHLMHGIGVVALTWRWLDDTRRHARIGWWSGKMLRLLGIAIDVRGTIRPGATLLVANHVSWLDILALHAVCPHARFVSKADVRHWPLLGWLIAAVGTLFIERARARDAMRVVHQVADALQSGQTVAVFPEGTTGDGTALLPFHANLLQAAIATATPVQAVALRYGEPGRSPTPTVTWIGATTLLHSVWAIARATGLVVHVVAVPAVGSRHADRRALARRVQGLVAEAIGPAAGVE